MQCSFCKNKRKRKRKLALSLYTSRTKKKNKEKKHGNCSCDRYQSNHDRRWHVPNALYEKYPERSDFSVPSPTLLTSHPSSIFSDAGDFEKNTTFSTIDGDMRHNSTHEVFTSTPLNSPIIPTRTSEDIISDPELFSLGLLHNSDPISPTHPRLNVRENIFLSNDELISLAQSSNDNSNSFKEDNSDNNEDVDDTISTTSDNLITPQLMEILQRHNLAKDFINLHKSLLTGTISPKDQPILSALDYVRFKNLKDTRSMTYSDESRDFWMCVHKLLGGPCLRLFSGPKGSGEGNYDPKICRINFAVPSLSTILRQSTDTPKQMMPSIFTDVIHNMMLMNQVTENEYILSYDGKGVAQGFRGPNFGDISLWGLEGPPTLTDEHQRLQHELELAKNVSLDVLLMNSVEKRKLLQELLRTVTLRIKELRQTVTDQQKITQRCLKMKEKNPDFDLKYSSMAYAEEIILECKLTIKKCLNLNREICLVSSHLGECYQFCSSGLNADMSTQSNYKELLPPDKIDHLLLYKENSIWVKQGSELWHDLRSFSVVTGSTCSNAIGLNSLGAAKKHFETHVQKKPQEISPDLQAIFDHGKKFEKKAVATLVGLLIPALFPPCHKLFEVGPVYGDSEYRERMLEVSADGLLKCDMGGGNCPHACDTGDKTYVIEIKSPVSENIFYNYKYCIPKRYVPQVLCEQFIHTAFKGLFITCTEESVILNSVDENIDLWNKLAEIVFDIYGGENIKKPTKLHPEIATLKKEIGVFSQSVTVLAEVPTYSCTDTDMEHAVAESDASPYMEKNENVGEHLNLEQITEKLKIITLEATELLKKCSEIRRQKATELLIFMASDTNRMKTDQDESYTHPTGYVLKGNSLPVSKMRKLVDMKRDAFKEKNIPILCESFDGQWANLAFETSDGFPLTLVHLQKKSWQNACNLSKKGALTKIIDLASLTKRDKEFLSVTVFTPNEGSIGDNYSVFMKMNDCGKKISAGSNGGHIRFCGLLRHINLLGINPTKEEIDKFNQNRKHTSYNKAGLRDTDVNILSTLPQNIINDICDENSVDMIHQLDLGKALTSEKLNILDDICSALRPLDSKWENCSPETIYPNLLTDKHELSSQCRHVELNAIGDALKTASERQVFLKSDSKSKKVDTILYLFGGQDFYDTSIRKVKPLKQLCSNIVGEWELLILQCIYAKACHVKNKMFWKSRCTVEMTGHIPILSCNYPLFSFPEFSSVRQQIEPRTMDYTHMLTNIRSLICRKGFDTVKTEPFNRISMEHPEIISRGLVMGSLDKQSAEYALTFFSQKVQDQLEKNGDFTEALFVRLFRNWHRACDERGMSADERINNLWALSAYLTKDINFDHFPAPTQYIKGIPVLTYCGLLQNISTRILLYRLSKKKTYNARSISSLVCESFFSTVTAKDPSSSGCPKAVDVPRILSDIICIENYKNRTDRNFFLSTARVQKYPEKRPGDETEMLDAEENRSSYYKDHHFDMPVKKQRHVKRRKKDISQGSEPQHRVRNVRSKFHKVDESMLPPLYRSAIPRPYTQPD